MPPATAKTERVTVAPQCADDATADVPDMSSDRPALTFVTRALEPRPTAGAPIRTHRLLTGLARSFAVTVVTFEHTAGSPHAHHRLDELQAALPGVEVVAVPGLGPHKRLDQVLALPRPHSYEWGRYRRRRLKRAVAADIAARRPAVVHFDDPGVAQVASIEGPLHALAAHNVEHRILASAAEGSTGLRARYARLEATKVAREERSLWRRMGLCIAVSELDAEVMRANGARRVIVCPNGTDAVDPLPPSHRHPGEPLRLLFVGTGSYWPNGHGVSWLVRRVLPRLRGIVDVSVEVVGSTPRQPALAPEVTYVGRVPDVRPHYQRAHAVVVPLHHGSGTRLKVVEAMAYGRPVVSTALGAEGLPVQANKHFLVADDAAAFAASLVSLARRLEGPDGTVMSMVCRARAAISDLFWPEIADRLADVYMSLSPSRRAPAAKFARGTAESERL